MKQLLVVAEGPLLDHILDHTYAVWNEGLSRQAYGRWNRGQMQTEWGRRHLRRFALLAEDGRLLASAKRYRFDVRVDGRDGWMSGLGAIFTPPHERGRGYASALVEQILERDRRDGALLAGLFSEIGAAFYERFGFRHVPLDEVTISVVRKHGAPAMLVRTGEERDLPALASIHERRAASMRFVLHRDPSLIGFAHARRRLLAGLGPPGLRRFEFFVAEEGASAVAYVVLSVNDNGWTLEEAGDRDPTGARVGGMLQVLIAREPARSTPLIRAWWPRTLAVPPQLTLSDRADARDLFMLRPLTDVVPPTGPDEVFYWRVDAF